MHFCFRSACVLFVAIPPAPCCWHCTTPTTTAPCYRWDAGFVARSRVGPRRIVRVELWQPARRQRPSQLWAGRGRHNQLPSWCAGWVRPWGVTCVPLALAFSITPIRFYVFSVIITNWLIFGMQTCVPCEAGNNPRTCDLWVAGLWSQNKPS